MRNRGLFSLGFTVLVMLVVCPRSWCGPQEPPVEQTDWHFRYDLFQMLLEQNQVTTVTRLNDALKRPKDSVIVIIGRGDHIEPWLLDDFCEGGGRLLIACDQRFSHGRIGEFMVSPGTLFSRDADDWYQNHPDCLVIRNLKQSHPLLKDVKSLVVNRSGWLAQPRWARRIFDVVARLPVRADPVRAARQPVLAEVRVRSGEPGRLILCADPSLFSNGMLWHGDNAMLAINMARRLTDDGRSQLLFIVDQQFQPSYVNSPFLQNPNLPESGQMPKPDLETLVRIGNSVIRNIEDSNVLNEAVAEYSSRINPRRYARSILFTVAAMAGLFVVWLVTATNATTHPHMPLRRMRSAHELATARKTNESEFGFAASMLAREFFREITGSSESQEWRKVLDAVPISGTAEEMSAAKQIRQLLDLAVNSRTVHISRRSFEGTGRIIEQLRHQHQQGSLFRA